MKPCYWHAYLKAMSNQEVKVCQLVSRPVPARHNSHHRTAPYSRWADKYLLGKHASEPGLESGRMKMETGMTRNLDTLDKMDTQLDQENHGNGNVENSEHANDSESCQEELKKELSHKEW